MTELLTPPCGCRQCLRDRKEGDYNGKGMTLVRIVDRLENTASQSRICFRVTPTLKNGTSESLYDADWFEPAPRDLL